MKKTRTLLNNKKNIQSPNIGSYYENDNNSKLNPLAKFDIWTQDLGKKIGAANYKTTLGMAEKTITNNLQRFNDGKFQ